MRKPCPGDSGSGVVWTKGGSKVLVGVHIEGTKCDHVGPSMSNPVKCEIVFIRTALIIYLICLICQLLKIIITFTGHLKWILDVMFDFIQ